MRDFIVGSSGPDFVDPGAGDDTLFLRRGDDIVRADLSCGDFIDAGSGLDTIADVRGSYHVARSVEGITLLASATGLPDGELVDFEHVQFEDGTLLFEYGSANDALVYRLYQASFARTPDEVGFMFWADQSETANLSPLYLAKQFQNSAEFTEKYGANLSDYAYTEKMYANVLGRAPDQTGIDFWSGHLSSGAISRDQLLINFAESEENVALTAPNMDLGFWVI